MHPASVISAYLNKYTTNHFISHWTLLFNCTTFLSGFCFLCNIFASWICLFHSILSCLTSCLVIRSKVVYWRVSRLPQKFLPSAGQRKETPGTFTGTQKTGPLVHYHRSRQPRSLPMKPGCYWKKLSHIFSSFLKNLVDKSVGVCYYNWAVKSPRSDHESLQEQRRLLYAGVAQSVEQLICNQQVGGSSPSTSSIVRRSSLCSVSARTRKLRSALSFFLFKSKPLRWVLI